MNTFRYAASLLPLYLCGELLVLPEEIRNKAEEIRLRTGCAMTVLADGKENAVANNHVISADDILSVLEKATYASLHTVENELVHGYITVECGVRIGICGTGIIKNGKLYGIKDFSSMAIRIPHDIVGCSSEVCNYINRDGIKNVLIISPPGYGKTTFLRDYIRCLSERKFRVSVADERGEISGMNEGVPQFYLGNRTDVMNGVQKSEAAIMLLKTMNPQVIAMDEISDSRDVQAVTAATGCGVKILATAHAGNVSDLKRRRIYAELIEMNIFDYAVIIGRNGKERTYKCEALK